MTELGPCRTCGSEERYKSGNCAPCSRAAARRWRERHPEANKEAQRAYRARYPERVRARQKKYWEENREKALAGLRASKLWTQYGLTTEDFNRMVAAQDGGCAICGGPPKVFDHLCVDHDHETGDVRGLLCVSCNNGLGRFRDNPEHLRAAAEYLEQAKQCDSAIMATCAGKTKMQKEVLSG